MSQRTTPDALGYLLAVFVSIVLTALGLALRILADHGPEQAAAALVVGGVYVTIFAVPTAPVGVLLVHLASRRLEHQWVHVLAAGLAGALAGIALGLLVDVGSDDVLETWSLALTLGISTAIGRAAVIPLVPAFRDRRRAGIWRGSPPVDDDFAGTPHRW